MGEAAAIATGEEASFDDLDAFGRRLRQLGEERNGEVGQLLIVDGLICSYMMAAPEQAAIRGFLAPSIEWTNGAAFPPPPDRFPDSVREYIAERAATSTIAQLAARYHDFIWLRWKDHRNGRAANVIAHALGALPREDLEMTPAEMARHPNEWLRALGAVVWAESPNDEEIGLELARDSSPHVRRSLSANLTSDVRHAGVRAILSVDPRRSVRLKVESLARADL